MSVLVSRRSGFDLPWSDLTALGGDVWSAAGAPAGLFDENF
jgi:hypothetical protein